MIARALENFATSGSENCSAVVADVRSLPYEGDSFDKINCLSIIQYLRDKQEGLVAILELYRVLKVGEVLLLGGVPNAQVKKTYIDGIWQLNKSQEEK